ncbi:hypothetical protein [Pseudoalteromonas sp. S16_S37]|uniref:hypothetical protein n=1 Tax=Pseudoalteromonas sp. S16_S37 TaxID=2720228 RepID=UPI0016806E6F|nr:hypothetical protein [Pseudoalteromonas sp. S16_S37]MBD1581616.1 hypothetical protein [Pseudoalteromonas sp. S16_S37]
MSTLSMFDQITVKAIKTSGINDIYKYTKDQQFIYIKYYFVSELGESIKPNLSIEEASFTQLHHKHCYCLTYLKNKWTGNYDAAFFMDSVEMINGLDRYEANKRLNCLHTIARAIRAVF